MSSKASGTSVRGTADGTARNVKMQAFVQGLLSEMRRVTWPTQQEWISATILTIGLVVCMGFYTFAVDEFFSYIFGLVHR